MNYKYPSKFIVGNGGNSNHKRLDRIAKELDFRGHQIRTRVENRNWRYDANVAHIIKDNIGKVSHTQLVNLCTDWLENQAKIVREQRTALSRSHQSLLNRLLALFTGRGPK